MSKEKTVLKRKHKTPFFWIDLSMVIMLIAGLSFSALIGITEVKQLREDLKYHSQVIARSLNVEHVSALTGQRADSSDAYYPRLKAQFQRLNKMYPQGSTVFLVGRNKKTEPHFLLHSSSELEGWITEDKLYPDISAHLSEAIDAEKRFISYSGMIYTFSPVKEGYENNPVAYLGIGIEVNECRFMAAKAVKVPLITTVIFLLVLLAFKILLNSRFIKKVTIRKETFITGVCALSLTLMVSWKVHIIELNTLKSNLSMLADTENANIIRALESLRDEELGGLTNLIRSNQHIQKEDFSLYTKHLVGIDHVHGWAWIEAVKKAEESGFEQLTGIEIWKENNDPIKDTEFYHYYYPVVHREPSEKNDILLGFDHSSEKNRKKGIKTAYTTDLVSASDPVVLITGEDSTKGIILYRAVRDINNPLKLRGFATAVIEPQKLLRNTVGSGLRGDSSVIDVRLWQVDSTTPDLLAYSSKRLVSQPFSSGSDIFRRNFSAVRPVLLFGKVFAVEVLPGLSFSKMYPARSGWLVGLLMSLISLSVIALVNTTANKRDKLKRQVDRRTVALKKSEAKLNATLLSIGEGVITTDIFGKITMINSVAETLSGWTFKEAYEKPIETVLSYDGLNSTVLSSSPVSMVLSNGKVYEPKKCLLLKSKDGKERLTELIGAPIKEEEGVTGVVLVFRDVTEKEKLIEATQLNQRLQSLSVLAGGIAHDFNNMLTGIYGYIDLASESEKEQAGSYLKTALDTITKARGLSNQLLTFAKGGAPVKTSARLSTVISECINFVLSGSKVVCKYTYSEDLYACFMDKSQIAQVIDNILINALQAMPEGGEIEITAKNHILNEKQHPYLKGGRYVLLSIKDHGIGIEPEKLNRIYDPFFSDKPKGHGLGLSTCYSIISRHEGAMDVESKPNEGTTFHIILPASENQEHKEAKKDSARHKGKGLILIMDDEEILRKSISAMVEAIGYRTICAKDGKEAVELFMKAKVEEIPFTAAILDLTIPGAMGGKEAIKKIREEDKEVPAFVFSGYADDPVMADPNAYGFTASIPKPFRISELSEVFNRYLRKCWKAG
ncbi:ATP-binding protein [Chitinispirillales bacterium ANBcel5]|uniref:ATP-binding protein n=1 Tax=Cellulosispirillum alkaliphilum TaxID=3039283 RepID=UPI002A55D690|nr:ATP-binding protein [Chitinispirillales bacterium ANBcel5]